MRQAAFLGPRNTHKARAMLLSALLLLSGCTGSGQTGTFSASLDAKTRVETIWSGSEPDVSMEITSFRMDCKRPLPTSSDFLSCIGDGVISVKGDGLNAAWPYLVILKERKIRGGSETTYRPILAVNGIGKFGTFDMGRISERPEYEFEIVGFSKFDKIPGVSFEVVDFSLTHSATETEDGFYSESYQGKGLVSVSGEGTEELTFVPIVFYAPKGGNLGRYTWFFVHQGVGEFQTLETSSDPSQKLAQPDYDFQILGAIPFLPPGDQLDFIVASFILRDELGDGSLYGLWVGEGILKAIGNADLIDRPHLVALKITRDDGNVEHQLVPVIQSVGQFSVNTLGGMDAYVNRKPSYDIEVLGYSPIFPNEP